MRRWDNRVPASDGTVYLTNGSVSDHFVVFDSYDWRSVIENGIFKEGKHPWHLGKFPKRTEAAVVGSEGMARWRFRLKEENRDKVIIFVEEAYGNFYLPNWPS